MLEIALVNTRHRASAEHQIRAAPENERRCDTVGVDPAGERE